MGGYIAANHEIIDYVRSFAPGFIFTTSICPSIAAGTLKAINIVSMAEQLRIKILSKCSAHSSITRFYCNTLY